MKKEAIGTYETAKIIRVDDGKGGHHTRFDDTLITTHDENCWAEREMEVDGGRFKIHSIFSLAPRVSTEKKLLRMIDLKMELQKSCCNFH